MALNLIDLLTAENPCPQAWADLGNDGRHPKAEVGYIRADFNGYRWWNTVWPVNKALETPEIVAEIDAVYDAFLRDFPSLEAVRRYCRERAEETSCDTEFNAYLEMPLGFYWLRLITRDRDYNLYLHCISKVALEL